MVTKPLNALPVLAFKLFASVDNTGPCGIIPAIGRDKRLNDGRSGIAWVASLHIIDLRTYLPTGIGPLIGLTHACRRHDSPTTSGIPTRHRQSPTIQCR